MSCYARACTLMCKREMELLFYACGPLLELQHCFRTFFWWPNVPESWSVAKPWEEKKNTHNLPSTTSFFFCGWAGSRPFCLLATIFDEIPGILLWRSPARGIQSIWKYMLNAQMLSVVMGIECHVMRSRVHEGILMAGCLMGPELVCVRNA